MTRVTLVTNMPVFHQCELFTALAAQPSIELHVLFLRQLTPGRQWTRLPDAAFPHTFVRELRVHPHFYLNAGLLRALRRSRPDLIIVGQYASIGMQLVMYYATAARIPWVFWSERPGVEVTELPIISHGGLRRTLRLVATLPLRRWPREIWGIGERARRDFATRASVPCANVPYISDLGRFFDLTRRPGSGPVRFLYSGKLVLRKGVDLLVDAVDQALAQRCDMAFTFMGDGELRPAVERLAAAHPQQVDYLGFKEMDEIGAVLADHDVLICPSRYDGWGMVVPEAMASGLAIIASDAVGAALDMVAPRRTGLVVPSQNAGALRDAILELASDRDHVARAGLAARDAVRPFHTTAGAVEFARQIRRVAAGDPA